MKQFFQLANRLKTLKKFNIFQSVSFGMYKYGQDK